jgi:hypothetical protein
MAIKWPISQLANWSVWQTKFYIHIKQVNQSISVTDHVLHPYNTGQLIGQYERDQVLHPYKTVSNSTTLYILRSSIAGEKTKQCDMNDTKEVFTGCNFQLISS